jgi:hypothetical protein
VTAEDPQIIELADRLKQSVRESRRLEIAQIQILGVEAIKERGGEQWSEMWDRVRESSLEFIRRRMSPEDLVVSAGDGILVVYGEADGAAQKSRVLQTDLDAFYLRDQDTHGVSAEVRHERLRAADLMQRLNSGGAMLPVEAPVAPADIPLTMLPVWSVAQQAITGYWIAPDHKGRSIGRYSYDPAWVETGWHREHKAFLDLDLRILERAVTEVKSCLERNKRCLVGYSVHSTTLLDKNDRRTFLQALADIPPEVKPLLSGRIAELQAGTPLGSVAEWAQQLRRANPRVAIEVHYTQMNVTGMEDLGLTAMACVLPTSAPNAAETEMLARNITVWNRDLKKQNLKLVLDNVDDPRLLGMALDAQIDFCSSPRLWPAVSAAEGVRPYSKNQFLLALPLTAADRRSA